MESSLYGSRLFLNRECELFTKAKDILLVEQEKVKVKN